MITYNVSGGKKFIFAVDWNKSKNLKNVWKILNLNGNICKELLVLVFVSVLL